MTSPFLKLTLFLVFLFENSILRGAIGKCHVDDEAGLLGFKSGITDDPRGTFNSWQPGSDCCGWWGVECRVALNYRVTGLMLNLAADQPDGYMSGTLSPTLAKIRHLDTLWLRDLRNVTGTFPKFLFNLRKLEYVFIENTKLSGPIPIDFGQRLSGLYALSLAGNRFTGSIPNSISHMIRLTYLKLEGNLLTGKIPTGIGSLKNLTVLNFSRNRLSGNIPDVFATLTNLWLLNLSHNKLSGSIPQTISALAPRLSFMLLGHNALGGQIPTSLGNFRALDTLDLSSNRLSGTVPQSFKNLTKIFNLDLSRNNLVGPFPPMNVKGIESLDLSHNGFKLGKIPSWVTSSPIIYSLKLAGCGIKMKLQDWKPSEPYYYDYIDLSSNEISGSPLELWNRTDHIVGFWASGNKLKFKMSGSKLPETLKYLDLSRNRMFGKVPESISGLKRVNVSYNHLCGQLPVTKFPVNVFEGNDCLCGSPLPHCN